MKFAKSILVSHLVVFFLGASLFGRGRADLLSQELFSSRFKEDRRLSLMIQRSRSDADIGVYLSDEEMNELVRQLREKGITLKPLTHKEPTKPPLAGVEELKAKQETRGDLHDRSEPPHYERYSARTSEGVILLVASHYYNEDEKRWVKKTNATIIRFLDPLRGRGNNPE